MKNYSTSEIAKIIKIHPNTVMLYEKWGYIAPVNRKVNGYRVYTEADLEQLKLIRIALRPELIKCYMRIEAVNVIRTAATGELEKALELSKEYLAHIQREKDNEFEVLKIVKEILERTVEGEQNISLNRTGASKLLGVSTDLIINWERNGFLEVPRNKKNGYRIYTEREIKLLRVIQVLKKANYCTQCICRMLNKLKTLNESDLEEENNKLPMKGEVLRILDNTLLSSLAEAEEDIKELISYITELINKSKVNK